jgi:hypothetical protein
VAADQHLRPCGHRDRPRSGFPLIIHKTCEECKQSSSYLADIGRKNLTAFADWFYLFSGHPFWALSVKLSSKGGFVMKMPCVYCEVGGDFSTIKTAERVA